MFIFLKTHFPSVLFLRADDFKNWNIKASFKKIVLYDKKSIHHLRWVILILIWLKLKVIWISIMCTDAEEVILALLYSVITRFSTEYLCQDDMSSLPRLGVWAMSFIIVWRGLICQGIVYSKCLQQCRVEHYRELQ